MALIFQNHPVLTFLCRAQCYPLRKGLLTRPPVTVNPLNHIFSAFFLIETVSTVPLISLLGSFFSIFPTHMNIICGE